MASNKKHQVKGIIMPTLSKDEGVNYQRMVSEHNQL